MSSTPPSPPPHARPTHTLTTPRLTLRSALPTDARAFTAIRSHPKNNPFGGVVNAQLSESEQREKILAQVGSTARGENAWVNVVLKPSAEVLGTEEVEDLIVNDGILVGMSGFNSFKFKKVGDEGEEVLVGDTGALIDWRFSRRGLAIEVLEAVFEYGFYELGCGKMMLETDGLNVPFRGVMTSMGLGDVEREVKGREAHEDEVIYLFGKSEWGDAKKGLKERGKWYLDGIVNLS